MNALNKSDSSLELLTELFDHFGGEPPAEFYEEGTEQYQVGLELFDRVREHLALNSVPDLGPDPDLNLGSGPLRISIPKPE